MAVVLGPVAAAVRLGLTAATVRLSLSAAVVLGLATAATAQGEWKTIAPVASDAPGMSYDAARTTYEPPYMTTWTRVVLAAPAKLSNGVEYSSALQKLAVDCAARTWTVVHSDFFESRDATGAAAYSYTLPREQWELRSARAGSSGESVVRILCVTPGAW